ncbi:hypothetical protein BZG02_07265 [Labilibaculum filiforme]|uniref:Uncharacterized protein n=1 Tax=Labilibaculum filiforme TaxID=1940526 RepID=A0A2N3I0G7_9BACT|nr:hypothetical protein [Labilibaculum filiforme]PKQ63816.1 hypothetical protein BZG02_07265 [Labilibaculum filiforme]
MEIEKLEKQYRKINNKLNGLKEFGDSIITYIRYKQKEIELKNTINQLLAPLLEANNPEFRQIANENYELLKNLNFQLKTRTLAGSVFGYYSSELQGNINQNGVVYCRTKKSNFPIINLFASFEFTSLYKGEVDCLGNIILRTAKLDGAFIKTIPSTFTGTIQKNGKDILVETNVCDNDFTLGGKIIIYEIVGNPFGKQNDKKDLFFSNKKKLEHILLQYRKEQKYSSKY